MSVSVEQALAWCQKLIDKSPGFPSLEECLPQIPQLDSLADLPAGTRVLVRCDTDVAFLPDGTLEEDVRLRSLVETLRYGVSKGWVQIVYGHIGRKKENSLQPVAPILQQILVEAGVPCGHLTVLANWMSDDTGEISDATAASVSKLPNGAIVILENTRAFDLDRALWKVKKDELAPLAPKIAAYANGMFDKLAQVHVNEGFASSNRDLSSTVVPLPMRRIALGKYIDGEMRTHLPKTRQAELVIFSGMKLEKLDDLQAILNRGQVKMVIAAGLLAMTLKKAAADLDGGTFEMGAAGTDPTNKFYIPPERIEQARTMITNGRKAGVEFVLPIDFILADGTPSDSIPAGGSQLDVGPRTIALHAAKVGEFIHYNQQKIAAGKGPAVAFHNGVFGYFEKEEFAKGTREFMLQLKRMTEAGLLVYVGGGEGGAALHKYGDDSWVTHCYTAGGTILKALGTEPIPYVKALYLAATAKRAGSA